MIQIDLKKFECTGNVQRISRHKSTFHRESLYEENEIKKLCAINSLADITLSF